MERFFSKKQTQSISRPGGKAASCAHCGLYDSCKSPMLTYGKGQKNIMILGETVTSAEDRSGKLWVDSTMSILRNALDSQGIDMDLDCFGIAARSCYSENPITTKQVECCRKNILKLIKERKPTIVLVLGKNALFSLIGHRWDNDFGEFSKWVSWQIPDIDLETVLCPIYHPIDVQDSVSKVLWRQDIKKALSFLSKSPKKYAEPNISHIEDLSVLRSIKSDLVSIDFETTGLKPQSDGHRVVCAAVAYDENHAYSFLIPKRRSERKPFLELLTNPRIGKMGHNIKYEDVWSSRRLHTNIVNWRWCSMQAAHILDNRPGICGLKFLTYVHFGVIDYASEISPYLRSPSGGNNINKVLDTLQSTSLTRKLLDYCGSDTVYQYRLSLIQIKKINPLWKINSTNIT